MICPNTSLRNNNILKNENNTANSIKLIRETIKSQLRSEYE